MANAKVLSFPMDRMEKNKIPFCDPGLDVDLNKSVRGKVPPHNLDAEAAVLSTILGAPLLVKLKQADGSEVLDATSFALSMLRPEHFYSETNGRVFQACQRLFERGTPIDVVTVEAILSELGWLQKMGGALEGKPYLDRLAYETPSVGHVEAHAEAVLACWEMRQIIATCQRISAELYDSVGDWNAYKATARAAFGQLTAARSRTMGAPIGAAVNGAHASIVASQEGAPPGVLWGFQSLDGFGLLSQGKQHILAARPGMGKTALAFQVAVQVANNERDAFDLGESVYFCSWEMSAADLLEREACCYAGVSYKRLQRRQVGAEQLQRVGEALSLFRSLPIWIDESPCTPAELAARVRDRKRDFERGNVRRVPRPGEVNGELFHKCRMRLVAIDQLSEVPPPAEALHFKDSRDIVGATAKGLRNVARRLNVATVVLHQLGRPKPVKGLVEAPSLHELRESGKIEEGADEVFSIHRPEYYVRGTPPEDIAGVAYIDPLKGRYGHEGRAVMGFYGGYFCDDVPMNARRDA